MSVATPRRLVVAAPAAHPRPRLRALPAPAPRGRRRPSARSLTAYLFGLTVGFALAALAAMPATSGLPAAQLSLAGAASGLTLLAALRARACARRRA